MITTTNSANWLQTLAILYHRHGFRGLLLISPEQLQVQGCGHSAADANKAHPYLAPRGNCND